MPRFWILAVATLTLFAACVSAQDPPPASTPAETVAPSYPDSPAGLEKLFKDLLKAAKNGEKQPFALIGNSMRLPNAEAWFKNLFGEEVGAQAARDYELVSSVLPSKMMEAFSMFVREDLFGVHVTRFDKSCEPTATAEQYPVLAARRQPVPFYRVHVANWGQAKEMWFFVYVDGAFRYVGAPHLFVPVPKIPSGVQRLRVGGSIQQSKLIRQDRPTYPQRAKAAWIQGTVTLQAVIGVDGAIRDLRLIKGHCYLAEAAMDAVRKWRYSPTLVDGTPVEVIAVVEMHFRLST